jgi:hypothetical protein
MAAQMIRWAKTVSLRGIRKARGELAPEYFALAVLQEEWISLLTPSGDATMWIQDPGEIARILHSIFESLHIPYYIAGGVCSPMEIREPPATWMLSSNVSHRKLCRWLHDLNQRDFTVPLEPWKISNPAEVGL